MAKRFWISIPLVATCEANDAAVISFLKGGPKKELEVEVAAFITNWVSSKNAPFRIDVERSSPERNSVAAPAPQGVSDGAPVPVVAETDKVVEVGDVAQHSADTAVEQIAEEAAVAAEPAGEQAEVVNDESAPQLNAPGGTGLGRARGKAKRRVAEASEAEE